MKTWPRIVGICFTVSLIVGMIGGALTNEYFVSYLFGRFIREQEEKLPIIKKVIEEHTYVEESQILDAINNVKPSLVAIVDSQMTADKIVEGENTAKDLFISKTSDKFYLNRDKTITYPTGTVPGGTGYFLTSDGIIATCNSLIDSKKDWIIITNENKTYNAEVIYSDPYDDFSLIKIKDKNSSEYFQPIVFAEAQIKSGQKVLALGVDVLKNYRVKSGVISTPGLLDYDEGETDRSTREFPGGFIQVDFEIDSSLHCGPTVNLGGEFIGMTLDFDSVEEGISYVIPVQTIQNILFEYQQ